MAVAGEYPKIDGDVLYAKDLNMLFRYPFAGTGNTDATDPSAINPFNEYNNLTFSSTLSYTTTTFTTYIFVKGDLTISSSANLSFKCGVSSVMSTSSDPDLSFSIPLLYNYSGLRGGDGAWGVVYPYEATLYHLKVRHEVAAGIRREAYQGGGSTSLRGGSGLYIEVGGNAYIDGIVDVSGDSSVLGAGGGSFVLKVLGDVVLGSTAQILAKGGDASGTTSDYHGGGGGLVAIFHGGTFTDNGATVDVSGGTATSGGVDGPDGLFVVKRLRW